MQAGKPRPNFLEVCKPAVPAAAGVSSVTAAPGSDTAMPESITVRDCTDGRDMADYLRSFPSGHASACMYLALYPIMYLLYTLLSRREVGRGHFKTSRLIWDVRSGLMTCFNGLSFALVRPATTPRPPECTIPHILSTAAYTSPQQQSQLHRVPCHVACHARRNLLPQELPTPEPEVEGGRRRQRRVLGGACARQRTHRMKSACARASTCTPPGLSARFSRISPTASAHRLELSRTSLPASSQPACLHGLNECMD